MQQRDFVAVVELLVYQVPLDWCITYSGYGSVV